MHFGQKVLEFHKTLTIPDLALPTGFAWLYPHPAPETRRVMDAFYEKYYTGSQERTFLFGINPGRFGAGITGVPFTDPVRLEADCGIANSFGKKQELSAQFVWRFIRAMGGPEQFSRDYYITAVVPLGLVKGSVNINYYDDRNLIKAVEPFAVWNIKTQIEMGANRAATICMGEGANFKFLSAINQKHGFFKEVVPLPHPRWVMQYRRKDLDVYLEKYVATMLALKPA